MSDDVSLKDRVLLYNLMQLPGQPQMMHVGSSNLVNDLAAEVTRLTQHLGEATGRIETDGRLIAELEAEVATWRASAIEQQRLRKLAEEERDRIREACAQIADNKHYHRRQIAAAIRAWDREGPSALPSPTEEDGA